MTGQPAPSLPLARPAAETVALAAPETGAQGVAAIEAAAQIRAAELVRDSTIGAAKIAADAAVKVACIRYLLAPALVMVCALVLMVAATLLQVPIPKP